MASKSIHWIEDLSAQDVSALTSLLRFPENCQSHALWLQDQERKTALLPVHLQRPKAFTARLLECFISNKALLCPFHKSLDPQLIRRLFLALVNECTIRVRHFAECPPEDPEIEAWLARVYSVNSLWTEPAAYHYLFNVKERGPRLEFVTTHCEACILSRLGGNLQILSDLRVCAETRRRKGSPTPRIIRFLEAWLYWSGDSDRVKQSSEPLLRKVRAERRRLRQERRGRPSRPSSRPESSDQADEKLEKETTGTEIIDFYLNRLSSMPRVNNLPGSTRNDSRASLHPAFRDSITFDNATGAFAHRQDDDIPPVPRIPSQFLQPSKPVPRPASSIYSYFDDSGFSSSSKTTQGKRGWRTKDYAEQRAETYRKLIGVPQDFELTPEETGSLANPDLSPSDRMTRWNDFCNAPSREKSAEERELAYRKLVGKPLDEELTDVEKAQLMDDRSDKEGSSPKPTWEEFSNDVRYANFRRD